MDRQRRHGSAIATPLSRDRVLQAAIAHADAGGLEALTMRKLAEVLGVAPMALYRHVANKDDLIDGMVDARLRRDRACPPAAATGGRPCGSGRSRSATRCRATAGRSA